MFIPKFYRCSVCGQMVSFLNDNCKCVDCPTCCGKPMTLLVANTSDGAAEKHVPVAERNGDELTVRVGSVAHPMTEEHFIEWVYVFFDNGGQRHIFKPGDKPECTFNVKFGKPVTIYAYCNIHGLWEAKL